MKLKRIIPIEYSGDVYNLQIEDNHNYFADNLLVSNCHSAKSYNINTIAKKCSEAEFRYGFTGTLFNDKSDNMNIQAFIGPVLCDLQSKELIEKGVLSKITIANILLKYPHDICRRIHKVDEINSADKETKKIIKKDLYKDEEKFVTEYSRRNKIFKWLFNIIPDKQNSLILVRKVNHLKEIEQYLLDNLSDDYTVFVVHGQVDTKVRETIRKEMEHRENTIIVATYQTFKQGINVKRLHNIIFASSMKSEITVPQAIGRGLRKHNTKERMILWDIVDDLRIGKKQNYFFKHFENRLDLYQENGFKFITKNVDLMKLD